MVNNNRFLNIITLLLSVLFALGACEVILIAIDWSPQKTTSEYLQFGYSTGIPIWDEDGVIEEARPVKIKLFQNDEELFWKTIPDTQFTNSQGFRGEQDITVSNGRETIRILILGDSCSFLGRKLYADFLLEQLKLNYPEINFEIINASVPGYTSFQGKKVLKSLMQYKPHYACIYFGWNDHWILPSGYSDQFHYDLIHSFKTVQLAKIMLARIMDIRDYRVPLDEFRVNLEEMQTVLKENGVVPILIAAPAGYESKGMPRWAFDFYQQYYRMTAEEIRDIPATHAAYAKVVADVSQDPETILVDGQASFDRLSATLKPFFRNDLIHLTVKGHNALAEEIYNQVTSYNVKNKVTWNDLLKVNPGK